MKIEELYLKNFRNIEEATYRFPSMFTVVIGMNGSGKSTILHALRVAAGAYFLGVPAVKSRHIERNELRLTNEKIIKRHTPVIVRAKAVFSESKTLVEWQRQILKEGGVTTASLQDVGEIKALGVAKYDKMKQEESDELDLPLIACFGTNRVFGAARKRAKSRIGREIFKEGYYDWWEMRSATYKYVEWLATYEPLLKNGKEYAESKQIFFDTILTACPYIKEVNFYNNELHLRTKMNGQVSDLLPIELHSDGIITFVEMVAELAYRCIVLNGYLRENAIKETRGVVLIDELDLHLHPKWQEHVVDDLKKAFPNLQFIVTTHSPIIVQSLSANELINLDIISDVNPNELTVGEVATNIMGLESEYSLKSQQEEEISKKYLELLENGNHSFVAEALDELEYKIIDPAVRAFLKMQRLKKESKK